MSDGTETTPGTPDEKASLERQEKTSDPIFDGAVRPTDKPPRKELPTSEVPDLGGEID